MKMSRRKVCIFVGMGFLIGVCFSSSIRVLWTPTAEGWQKSVRIHLLQEAEKLTSEELERVYSEARLREDFLGNKAPVVKDLAVLKGWIAQYVTSDMEPFIRKVIEGLPPSLQHTTWSYAKSRDLPTLLLKYEAHVGGSTSRYLKTIWLNPPILDSYDDFRATFSHELVHYWVQQVNFNDSVQIGEGITEYLTVKAFENLGWSLDFLHPGQERHADYDGNETFEDKNISSIFRSIRTLKKQSQTYPLQTNAASILLCLDSEHKLLSWYTGEAQPDFEPYLHIEQILEQQKIAKKDVRKWISVLKDGQDAQDEALQEFKSLNFSLGVELFKRRIILHDFHHDGLPVLALAQNFHKIDATLEERNFEPMLHDEWDLMVTASDKDLQDLNEATPREKFVLAFYRERVLFILKTAMYADMAVINTRSEDPFQRLLFSGLEKETSRREVIKTVTARIRVALFADALRETEWIKSEGYNLEEQSIESVKKESDKEEERVDRFLKKVEALLKMTTQHHVQMSELLRGSGIDPLPFFAQRGMPNYFLGQFK